MSVLIGLGRAELLSLITQLQATNVELLKRIEDLETENVQLEANLTLAQERASKFLEEARAARGLIASCKYGW